LQEYRAALDIDPKFAHAHYNLGTALSAKGQLDEAIAEYRTAFDLNPKDAGKHGNLSQILLTYGRFTDGDEAARHAKELSHDDNEACFRACLTQQLRQCEQFLALRDKLPAILAGKQKPADAAERLALARLCQEPFQKLYAASARFYAEVFEAQPELNKDPNSGYRSNAACAAALAGSGQGQDADKLDDTGRTRWRKQALDWLRADLELRAKQLDSGKPEDRATVQRALRNLQKAPELASLREQDAVSKLPSEEQEACRKLWAEVESLLAQAQGKK
jgi:tetratricopeptide (TPR) repeat protein